MSNFLLGIVVAILIDALIFTDVHRDTHLDRIEIVALDACLKGVIGEALKENVDCSIVSKELRTIEEQ